MTENQFSFSTGDPELDFLHLVQNPEHAGSDLFAGLEKIPLHMEEDPSRVEQWLAAEDADATPSIAQPSEQEDARASRLVHRLGA